MAFRPRTPTFRPQLSVRRVYETMQPRSEMKETPEAYLLHVYLPGFAKNSVKITYVGSSRMVKVTGERPLQGNRWTKFDQSYPVPEDSEPEALQGKFELGTLILTMPKKFTPQVVPKAEVEEAQEKSPLEKAFNEEAKPHKTQDTNLQKPTTSNVEEPFEDKKSSSPQRSVEDLDEHNALKEDKSSRKEFEPKPITPITTEVQTNEMPQKGNEEIEPKPTAPMATKVQNDETPQKDQEEIEPKPTSKTLASLEEQLKEKTVESKSGEKERISKEENKKPSETRKPVKAKKAETSVPKKEKESIAKGNWNDEEKHLVANISAAVLVIAALGAYVSYKFTS